MKYPDDFNTPAFPAGRFVAVSRFMAVAVMVLFFGIVCLCGIILWAKKSQDISPFLISINQNGERWTMIAHDNHRTEIPAYFVLQESLLNKFARSWFSISGDVLLNQATWAECSRDSAECRESSGSDVETCAIYCACDNRVYDNFKSVVLPVFSNLEAEYDAVWQVTSVVAKPLYGITETGGMWKLDIMVDTGTDNIRFVGYAKVSYNADFYPKTMGYYVSEFNTYRMN